MTLLYVSHRLPEVFRLCDRITVLRDGAFVEHLRRRDVDTGSTSCARWSDETCRRAPSRPAKRDGARGGRTRPIAGRRSAGAAALLHERSRCRCGAARSSGSSAWSARAARSCSKPSSACIAPTPARSRVDGAPVHASIAARRRRAPASRWCRKSGSARDSSSTSIDPPQPGAAGSHGRRATCWCSASAERREARRWSSDWRIKAAGRRRPARRAERRQPAEGRRREVAGDAARRVLLLDEPTKGVDVGAKFEIHEIDPPRGRRAASACLVVSSDLPEVLALADRILVMREGRSRASSTAPTRPKNRSCTWPRTPRRLATVVEAGCWRRSASSARSRSWSLEVLFFAWYLWPDGRPRASVSQRRERAADPEVLVDLRHRGGRRRDRDHLGRHRSRARRGHRARGRRHARSFFVDAGLAARRRAMAAGLLVGRRRRAASAPLLVVAGQAAAVHRHARRDGHHARRSRSSSPRGSTSTSRASCPAGWRPLGLPADWLAPLVMIGAGARRSRS